MKWEPSDTQKVVIAATGFATGAFITVVIVYVRLMWLGYTLSWLAWVLMIVLCTLMLILYVFAWAFEVWKSLPIQE